MIQAFYTAASGMQAQQSNIDVISNNISNMSTPGYRIKRAEFSELLYSQMQNDQTVGMIAGHGTKISSVSTMPLPEDVNPYGLATDSYGYFVVESPDGQRAYTKNGDFKQTMFNNRYYLTTQDGSFVLDKNYNRIEIDKDRDLFLISDGVIYPKGNNGEEGIVPAVVRFNDMMGVGIIDKDFFVEDQNTGSPQQYATSKVFSNYNEELAPLVMTNQINEITRLVQTQMAYQINSKALQIVDEMEGMANHLRN